MDPKPNEPVEVSIIVPSKTTDKTPIECINSILNQDYEGTYEILHVSGGNIPQAKNHAIKNATGRLIAFIDSDCTATPNWLTTITNQINSLNVAGVGGPGIRPPENNSLSSAIECVYSSYLGSLGSSSLKNPKKTMKTVSLSTHNCMYKKFVLNQVGGFDERYLMNEDTDLSNRIRAKEHELYMSPEPIVYHKRKKNLAQFTRKFYNYGISRSRAAQTNSMNIDYRIIGLLVASITSLLLTILDSRFLIIWSVYLFTIFSHGITCTIKNKQLSHLLLVPTLLLLEHIGYGLGQIHGIFKGKYTQPTTSPKMVLTKYTPTNETLQ